MHWAKTHIINTLNLNNLVKWECCVALDTGGWGGVTEGRG